MLSLLRRKMAALPREARDTLFLLAVIGWVVLPHVAHLHRKYAAQGLVTISVSLDEIKKGPEIKQKVLVQLQKADARMLNVILDEDFEFVQKKLRLDGPPCAFVFNRQGKWVEFREENFRHDLIEQSVVQFLKEP